MVDADVKDEAVPKQLGRIALKRRMVAAVSEPRAPESRMAELVALSERYGVPSLDLEQLCLKLDDLVEVPKSLALHHVLIPVLARSDRLFVAMRDPSQRDVIQEVEFVAGKRVYAYAAPPEDIARALERAYSARDRGELYFVGPSCPEETLQKVGLDAHGRPLVTPPEAETADASAVDASAVNVDPVLEVEQRDVEVSSRRVLSVMPRPEEGRNHRDSGPPATVSAYPARRSSLPPHQRPAGSEAGEEIADVVSAVEEAFDDMLEETSSACHEAPARAEAAEAGQQTVLVVDDEPEVRRALERLLRADGYAVRSTNNGQDALRMIKESVPDLLLLDAMLPEVHGFEIARRLLTSERYRTLPIVMVSAVYRGWRFAEDLRESCGVEHYLEKPFRPEDVRAAVQAALSQPSAGGEASDAFPGRAEEALEAGMAAYRAGQVVDAIGHLERGVAIDPLSYRLHFNLGLLFAQEGRIYDAIRALERAVEINSGHFSGLKNLAIMYGEAGFRNRAVELWERGLTLAPDESTRNAIREHLVGLLSQEGLS